MPECYCPSIDEATGKKECIKKTTQILSNIRIYLLVTLCILMTHEYTASEEET